MFHLVLPLATMLFQDDNGQTIATITGIAGACCGLIFVVAILAGLWMVFQKAGKPGWAAIVPLYNGIVILEIVGRPIWWIILFFIPFINLLASILIYNDLAKSFGKGVGWTIGLLLLPFVFVPALGFGSAQYLGPSAPQDGSLM